MRRMRLNLIHGFAVAVLLSPPLIAETSADEARQAEVQQVRFSTVQPAGVSRNWRQMAVQIQVHGPAETDVINTRFVDDVEVTVRKSYDVSSGGTEKIRFYRASVVLPTLERGRHTLHFFLPPEVVRRDRITGDPQAYEVLLRLGGNEQETGSNARSSLLARDSVRESFRERLEVEAEENDGILLPLHLTPFVNEQRYLRDMPSVRRGGE